MRRYPPVGPTVAEAPSTCAANPESCQMSDTTTHPERHATGLAQRPKRADARRNYEKLLEAASAAFTDHGTAASLEDIAPPAGRRIRPLFRAFPTRQALPEAVYVDEVEE